MKIKLNKNKIIIISVFVVLLIIGGALIFGKKGGDSKTFTAELKDITEKVELAGKVEANDLAELGFELSGKVSDIKVKVGDFVERGQVLVQLDSSELYADLKDAQALVDIKKAELYNAGVNLDDIKNQQDVLVLNAKRKLLSADLEAVPQASNNTLEAPVITGTYTGDEGTYKIVFERNTINVKDIVKTFGIESFEGYVESVRANRLGTKGLFVQLPTDSSLYNDTTWYVSVPNKQSSSYTANLSSYESALEDRTVAIREAEKSLNQGSVQNSIAKAELEQAQARVNRILAQVAQRTIRAPFSGTISNLDINEGEIASSGTKVVSIVSDGDYEISLDVPEIDVSKLEVGNPALITLDAFGEISTWDGEISAISQSETYVDGVPVYETFVIFKNVDDRIRSGLSATVSIVTDTKSGVVSVPAEAIDRDEKGTFVNVFVGEVDENKTEKRYITTGLRGSDGFVEIIEGLSSGEVVGSKS